MNNNAIYLDNAATTQLDPRVLEAMLPYFTTYFGNASSSHFDGKRAAEAVQVGRKQVANLIGSENPSEEIVFTSGATEANNLALKGVFKAYVGVGNHIITAVTEHQSVLATCSQLKKQGAHITYLSVKPDGLINPESLKAALTPQTILVSIMHVNNETGVIQPISKLSELVKEAYPNVLFHTDATQSAGKIPINVQKDGIHLLSFSAHKLYGPKGCGALYVRSKEPRVSLLPQIVGGGHENNRRSGTLNVPGIVGFGKACELAKGNMTDESKCLTALRNRLECGLLGQTHGSSVNGCSTERAPHISNMAFLENKSGNLFSNLYGKIAVSAASACSTHRAEPSHVLKSMGLSTEIMRSSLRFSLGRFTTEAEIDATIERILQKLPLLSTYKKP